VLGFHQLVDSLAYLLSIHLSSFSSSDYPTPPRALYAPLGAWGIGRGLAPTLLLDCLRLHLLLPSFLPNLLQQLPPIISDSEHRAVNVIVIRKVLPFTSLVLGLLIALQHIVVD
jgi:hypothetical protein